MKRSQKLLRKSLLALQLVISINVALAGYYANAADFKPEFLNGGQIGLCPGAFPQVINVGRVGASFAGGCCGYYQELSEDSFGSGSTKIRDDITRGLRGYGFSSLAYDASFASAIDKNIIFMEEKAIKNAQVSACMDQIDLVRVNQTQATGTDVDFKLSYKIYLTFDTPTGRQIKFVEQLAGSAHAHSDFFSFYYLDSQRPAGFVANSWPSLQGNFATFLGPVPNFESDQNLQAVKNDLLNFVDQSAP